MNGALGELGSAGQTLFIIIFLKLTNLHEMWSQDQFRDELTYEVPQKDALLEETSGAEAVIEELLQSSHQTALSAQQKSQTPSLTGTEGENIYIYMYTHTHRHESGSVINKNTESNSCTHVPPSLVCGNVSRCCSPRRWWLPVSDRSLVLKRDAPVQKNKSSWRNRSTARTTHQG